MGQDKDYGTELLRPGLGLARQRGMDKVMLTINEENTDFTRVFEKLGAG